MAFVTDTSTTSSRSRSQNNIRGTVRFPSSTSFAKDASAPSLFERISRNNRGFVSKSKHSTRYTVVTSKSKLHVSNESDGSDGDSTDVLSKDNADSIEEANNYEPPDDTIESQTMNWLKKVVIGYNLCPFAEKPLRENKLKVVVVRGDDDEWVATTVVYELIARSDDENPGTTIVVAPEYHPDDFEQYMSLVQYIEDDVMEEHELHGIVQVAPFHPLFEFSGSGKEGVDNFTNRSPYPIFHILRENEVAGAVDKLGGDASKVWGRNVRLLKSMEKRWGREGVEKAMRGEKMDGMDDLLKEIKLSDHRYD